MRPIRYLQANKRRYDFNHIILGYILTAANQNLTDVNEKKNLIKQAAGLVVTTGLTVLTQGSSSLLISVVNGIAGNLASSYIENAEYKKFSQLLKESDPAELNHDLQKLVVEAVKWSLLNIQTLYKRELSEASQVESLKKFTKTMLEEVELLHKTINAKEGVIYNLIEQPAGQETNLNFFGLEADAFPIINEGRPYPSFFKEKFNDNMQLCFGELLKKEANRPAYIAYQRAVYQSLDANIGHVIKQNEEILHGLTDLKAQGEVKNRRNGWQKVRGQIGVLRRDSVAPLFARQMDLKIDGLSTDTKLLIDISNNIHAEVDKVYNVSRSFSRELNQNWLQRNKVWVVSSLVLAGLVIAGLVYTLQTQPFAVNLALVQDTEIEVGRDYPELSDKARLKIYLPGETKDKQVTTANELVIADLQAEYKGDLCKVELLDRYWQLSEDSLTLNPGAHALEIRPNESLARIEGRILSRDGQELLSGVTVSVGEVSAESNEQGRFEIEVPYGLRALQLELRCAKEGYVAQELTYVAGSDIEIRLEAIE